MAVKQDYTRNIYSKLEVNNRTQAVARARKLKILASRVHHRGEIDPLNFRFWIKFAPRFHASLRFF